MRDTTEQTLSKAQRAGLIRPDVAPIDVMRLVHGVAASTEHAPDQTPRLLSIVLDGLRPHAADGVPRSLTGHGKSAGSEFAAAWRRSGPRDCHNHGHLSPWL